MSTSIVSEQPSSTQCNSVLRSSKRSRYKVALFGHFGAGNFGNEATLQAMVRRLRAMDPDIEISCICPQPELVATTYGIETLANREQIVKPWNSSNPIVKLARKLFVGVPSECYRWIKGLSTLRKVDALIVPGTGLLTDAYTWFGYGPYDMFRWSLTAKLCRCKLVFASVGAGPLYSRMGKFLVKASLALADFRSYRDESTRKYLLDIGVRAEKDVVYPDLVFSLPKAELPSRKDSQGRRPVVGLGLMQYAGKYSVADPHDTIYEAYLQNLVRFACWLVEHGYDIQLLIGDVIDRLVTEEFRSLLNRATTLSEGHIIDEPVNTVDDLLSQIANTDFVVATRFHNVLLSMMLEKPTIAISFHHKCSSLMRQMSMDRYCEDMNRLSAERLIEQFQNLERNAAWIRESLGTQGNVRRQDLERQYGSIIYELSAGRLHGTTFSADLDDKQASVAHF